MAIKSLGQEYKIFKEFIFLVLTSIIIGVVVAFYEKLLILSLDFYRYILSIDRWSIFIITPLAFLAAFLIVIKYAYVKRTGSGTHEILDAHYIHNGFIHPRDTVTKSIASLITLGFGGSVGPEGPSMLLGAGISAYLSRKFKISSAELRKFSLAGASAGISAIFRAPFTGMLFALEIPFKRDIESEAFIESMIASAVSYLAFVSIMGPEKIFKPELMLEGISFTHLLHSIILGIIISISAMIFISLYREIGEVSIKLRRLMYPRGYITPIIGGLLISLMIFVDPLIAGPGYIIISSLISGKIGFVLGFIFITLILKMVATSLSLSFGGSGGTFIPSLAVGALTGYLYSLVIGASNSYLFITVGMASMLAATNKTLLTAVALVAETVGPYTIIPTLIASTISYLLTGYSSFFEVQYPRRMRREELLLSEIYHRVREENPNILKDVKAFQIMTHHPVYLEANMKLRDALKKVSHFKFRCYPVLYKDKLVGVIELQDMLGAPEEDMDRNIILYVKDPIYITPDKTLEEVIEKMLSLDADHVFVVDKDWKLLGLIADRDIIRFLLGKYARYYK